MRRIGALGVVALAAALVACSSGGSSASSTSSSSSGATTSTTSTSAPTTTTTPSCAADEQPPGAVRVTTGSGDLDGDGKPDAVTVYADGTDSAPGPWHVLVTLGNGNGRVKADITDAVNGDSNQRVAVLGASIIAGPGQVLFVSVGSGASALIVGLFALDGCAFQRLSLAPSAEPAQLAIGGTVTHLDGLRCADGGLDRMQATSNDGTTYDTTVQRLTVSGSMLTADGAPTKASVGGADPTLQAFSILDCPGVSLP